MNTIDKLARRLNAIETTIKGYNTPQLSSSSIEDGSIDEYDSGALVGIIGRQYDGTHNHTVVNGPIPPTPGPAVVEGKSGMALVTWAGDFIYAYAPMDFARVEVHVSQDANFVPDVLPNSSTRVNTIEGAGGGQATFIKLAGTYYVRLVTRALSGRTGQGSNAVDVEVLPVVSEEELKAIEDALVVVNTDLDDLQLTLGNVNVDLTNAKTSLVALETELNGVDGTLAQLNTDLTNMDTRFGLYDTDLANAQTAVDNAIVKANGAVATAADAETAAAGAVSAADNAAAVAAGAKATGESAATDAAKAVSDALAAIDTATDAASAAEAARAAASAAQIDADDANSAALAAAGLADSKGEVITQASAPTGSRANSRNLWIRLSDFRPHTYNGTNWVAVTDKVATDAASAAVAAQTTANQAQQAANNAQGTANTALSTANGKNAITFSLTGPGNTPNKAGDIWFKKNTSEIILEQWEGAGGTTWTPKTLDNAVIASLDAGKITTGFINAGRIQAGSITIGAIRPGDVATPSNVSTAKGEAIATAAADATTKANNAKAAAEAAAALTAQAKADQAKADALAGAAVTAQEKADAAKAQAIADATAAAATDATGKANAAQAAAIAAAAAVEDRTLSRGTDLVTNGTGYLGNNYNFTSFDADLADVPTGATTAFRDKLTGYGGRFIDELISFDPTKRYQYSFGCRQTVPGATNRIYGMFIPYDSAGNNISPTHYMFIAGTTTTLAQPVNNGDTVIYLASVDNWYGQTGKVAGASSHLRAMIIWDYVDSNGKTWPAHTYSRNYSGTNRWADGAVDTVAKSITLNTPWDKGNLSAGHPVSNGSSGSSYMYATGIINTVVPEVWAAYSAVFTAGAMADVTAAEGRGGASWNTGVPPGTASIKVGWLLNAPANPTNLIVGRHAVALVSLSDASAAAQAAADQKALTDGWKFTGTTEINGGAIRTDTITAVQLAADSVIADKIAANAVVAGKIATNAVTANTIAANAITAGKIDADAVNTREIVAGAVTAEQIAANAVIAGTIAANAISARELAVDAVAAGTIAADAITARELAVDAVTAETILAGNVGADELAANSVIAGKIAANAIVAENITSGAITTAKLTALAVTADKLAANSVEADKIIANAITADKVAANAITTDKLAANAITADKIAANAITAVKIAANSIDVGKLVAGTLSADNITTGAINASISISTQGSVTAGDMLSSYTQQDSTGFHAYIISEEDNGMNAIPIASLGSGDNYLSFADTDLNILGGFSSSGAVSGQMLDIAQSATFNGPVLFNGDADLATHGTDGEFGPIIMGRGLFDNQFLAHNESHPRLDIGNKWMLGLAYGQVAYEKHSLSDFSTASFTAGYVREVVVVSFDSQSARVYNIQGMMGPIRSASSATVYGGLSLRYSTGTSPVGYDTGSQIGAVAYASTINHWNILSFNINLIAGVDIPADTQINLCLYFDVYAGEMQFSGSSVAALSVSDDGRKANDQIGRPNGRMGIAPSPPPVIKPKGYTKTYSSNWTQVFSQTGQTTNPDWHKSRLRAGRGGGSYYRSYAGFPSMVADLSGATVTKLEVYLYCDGEGASGAQHVGMHNHPSAISSEPGMNIAGKYGFRRNQGRWIELPSRYYADVKSGALRGVSVGQKAANSDDLLNFHRHTASSRPKIRISYRK